VSVTVVIIHDGGFFRFGSHREICKYVSVVTSFHDFYGCLFKISVKKNSNPPDALHEHRMYGKNVFLTVISQ